ncbi:serine/threonine-protein kinase [Polyangium sp. 6x1]|uniref:protein kinase domain-containing protein n=1 Tax=Polyangium sp. 6x1 TaxID=3042689 RepID=UPI0024825F31|nr:serine/threonine-protein kinase [Polyangium sp. 6x1]MDI1448384.1 serine/threonine-protein kinase [Polyangium sp. 6x1]
MRFSPGESFDRYVIESLLGEGGMGEVYRAEDTRLRRKIALKVLRKGDEADSETWGRAVARMLREARAVAALSHPGIVAIYDVGEHDGAPFIAMELVLGRPLRALVGGDEPLGTRLRILLEIARALSAAHQAGLVHRDVKPENVVVRADGAVKVLDFGIARKLTRASADPLGPTADGALSTMTAEGALVGTPAYMAPEQLRGEEIDARADQFAWGVVAYELLAGKLPFRSDKGAVSLMASILSDTPPPLTSVPDGVWQILARALAKEPEARFASMDEVAQNLHVFVTAEDTRTITSRRNVVLVSTGDTRAPVAASVPPASPSRRPFLIAASVVAVLAAFGAAFAFRRAPAEPPTPSLSSAVAQAGPLPTAVTDLPMPPTESAAARLAFREGLQAIRDATWDTAIAAFDRARKADPGMAAAHLRYASLNASFDIHAAREAFRKAIGLRASLSERDQAFLEALEPMLQNDPSDCATSARRFEAMVAKWPGDAELVFWYARQLLDTSKSSQAERVLELTNRCVELDPQYADCWQSKQYALLPLRRSQEALVALEKCIEVSAGAVDCLNDKIKIVSSFGQCDVAAETARRWMAKEPSSPKPHVMLAGALYGSGEPEAAVRAAFDQAERRFRASGQLWHAEALAASRAMAFGQFSTGARIADAMASMTPPLPQDEIVLYHQRLFAHVELGDIDGAVQVADEFLAKSALRTGRIIGDHALDPTVYMHSLKLRAGKETRAEFDAARSAWIAKQDLSTTVGRRLAWDAAYAWPAYSAELAEEALAKEAEYMRLPSGELDTSEAVWTGSLGQVRIVVGRESEALPFLEKATQICPNPWKARWYVLQQARLGAAREAKGDKPGACSAYRTVLSRWSNTKESVTARDVEKRAKGLGCGFPADGGLAGPRSQRSSNPNAG